MRARRIGLVCLVASSALGADICYQPQLRKPPQSDWALGPSLPEPLQNMQAVSHGASIYVAGGLDATHQPTVHAYRLKAGVWQRIADLPQARHHMMMTIWRDTIFAIGGFAPGGAATQTVWVYDTTANTWSARAGLPAPRAAGVAMAVHGQNVAWLVVAGGYSSAGVIADSTDRYDTTGQWHRGRPMITARAEAAGVLTYPGVSLLGGLDGSAVRSEHETYIPFGTDGWHVEPSLPAPRAGFGVTGYLDGLHVFGGRDSVVLGSHIQQWNSGWTTDTPMPTPRHSFAVAGGLEGVYVIGGSTQAGVAPTATVEVLTLAMPVYQRTGITRGEP